MADKPDAPKLESPHVYVNWVRENIEAIVVAYIMALFIRCFFVEVFQIPTSSMEPTLRGDTTEGGDVLASGDRIMVNKFYFGIVDLQRYDVAIFRFPLNQPKIFIKRCVGLPGETWCMYRGNIYTRPPGEPSAPLRIARKPLNAMDQTWIAPHILGHTSRPIDLPPFPIESYLREVRNGDDIYYAPEKDFAKYWILPGHDEAKASVAPGELSIQSLPASEAKIQIRERLRNHEGMNVLDDLRVAATFEAHSTSVRFQIHNGYGRFTVTLMDGKSELLWISPQGKERRIPLSKDIALGGRRYDFALEVFDGRCVVLLDKKIQADFNFIETVEDAQAMWSEPDGPQVTIGIREGTMTINDLSLGRDVHYREETGDRWASNILEGPDNAIAIPEGEFLFLGDNTYGSHDGRGWRAIPFKLKDGRTIVCETLELAHQPETPVAPARYIIKADRYGDRYEFDATDVTNDPEGESTPFITIPKSNILGRAFWVWFPKAPGKVRLIR